MNRMTRLPLLMSLLLAGACASTPPVNATPPGFRFRTGEKLRIRVEARIEMSELATGGESEDLFFRIRQSSIYELAVGVAGESGWTCTLTPVDVVRQMGSRVFTVKNGEMRDSTEGEPRKVDPCELEVSDDGVFSRLPTELGAAMLALGPNPNFPFTLLGWLGPLPKEGLGEGAAWKNSVQVLIAHATGLPIVSSATAVRRSDAGWEVDYDVRVDRTQGQEWISTHVEKGKGRLRMDAQQRPLGASVEWTVTSKSGATLGLYSWTCEFSR